MWLVIGNDLITGFKWEADSASLKVETGVDVLGLHAKWLIRLVILSHWPSMQHTQHISTEFPGNKVGVSKNPK